MTQAARPAGTPQACSLRRVLRQLGSLRYSVVASILSARIAAASAAPHVVALLDDGSALRPSVDHVALSVEFPEPLGAAREREAVRLVFVGFASAPPVRVITRRANGTPLDYLEALPLAAASCPSDGSSLESRSCWSSVPVRLTPDVLDRSYSAAHERSLEAELGGELQVEAAGQLLGAWRVGAPHAPSFRDLSRLSARLRVRILRVGKGGMPSIGGDAGSAVQLARHELLASSKLWAQCGVDLLGPNGPDIQIVDPPAVPLLAVGCDRGLPASGGQLNLRVQGRSLRVTTRPEESPGIVAERLARALRGLGLSAQLSPNQRISSGASGAFDILVRGARGGTVAIGADPDPRLPLSSDATLPLCLGDVDLSDGLSHFVEDDASAGTLEERALVKAFDDGDPSTIEVFIVPSFDQSGRIGESFIDDAGAGIQNAVILDRAALRAGPRSSALAHELGHIFLDMPGHPDDYGVDQPSSLMDSDASDASVFGPRRLDLQDCERMLRQSGPGASQPLLSVWPLAAVGSARSATSAR